MGVVAVQLDDEFVVRPVGVHLVVLDEGVDLRVRESGFPDHLSEAAFELLAGAGLDDCIGED
jgi:hypothetical protein